MNVPLLLLVQVVQCLGSMFVYPIESNGSALRQLHQVIRMMAMKGKPLKVGQDRSTCV